MLCTHALECVNFSEEFVTRPWIAREMQCNSTPDHWTPAIGKVPAYQRRSGPFCHHGLLNTVRYLSLSGLSIYIHWKVLFLIFTKPLHCVSPLHVDFYVGAFVLDLVIDTDISISYLKAHKILRQTSSTDSRCWQRVYFRKRSAHLGVQI